MPAMPAAKRIKLSPSKNGGLGTRGDEDSLQNSSFAKNRWNLEQDYETRPRKQKKNKENTRLPIKTADGNVEQVDVPADDSDESDVPFEGLDAELSEEPVEEVDADKPKLSSREEILQAKEELARIAALINEDPEEHSSALRTLGNITSSQNFTVTKLGLATQCAVYKDIVPGYRIRPAAEDEMKTRISKDVRKLRNFEQSIVAGYQKYVKELSRIAVLPASSSEAASLSNVAVSCTCTLLTSIPHFNFRTDLLRIVVGKLSHKTKDQNFTLCADALEKLFAEDEEGNASLEAVNMLAKMIKAKHYAINEDVLNLFLHLRLLTEFFQKASNQRVDRAELDRGDKRIKNKMDKRQKMKMSKNEKKLDKERRAIEKEMKDADATVTYEERDQRQGETLKTVFGVYFRVLKERIPHLTGAVLEGLVKYAHLINQEFFGDLLEALRELIAETEAPPELEDGEDEAEQDSDEVSRNVTRESLLCVITAFALLQGQDASAAASTLHLDLDFFISHLYRTLYPASMNADIEFSHKSLHLPDPHATAPQTRTRVNVQTTVVLLLRSLQAVLLPVNVRSVPPVRLAAFTRQILTSALHMPEKSCTAMVGLINQVAKAHKKRIGALWNSEERRGDGMFDPLRGQIEGSNPFASTSFEGELLRLHYAPTVREGVENIERIIGDE